MPRRSRRSQESLLSLARGRFARWRSTRPRGRRIPEELWESAVGASREVGVWRASAELRLDYYRLKARVEAAQEAPSPGDEVVRFEEVSLPGPGWPPGADCAIEMTAGRGVRLRVELRAPSTEQLGAVVRELWRTTR